MRLEPRLAMNRRGFLGSCLEQRSSTNPGGTLGGTPQGVGLPAYLSSFSRRAMGTVFSVQMPVNLATGQTLATRALDEIDRLERVFTVYQAGSEVSRLNQLAHERPISMSDEVFDILSLAQRLNAETAGAFDVTTGPFSKAWGFFERRPRIPTEDARAAASRVVGMDHVRLDHASRTLQFDTPGIEINLGSIGKGYALDRAADLLRRGSVRAALLDAGRSSVLAIGHPPEERGWLIGIADPRRPEVARPRSFLGVVARIWLRDRALATSAATYQFIDHNGKRLGHTIDPRTGWPAQGIESATVLAPTAAEADALSTAFFIMGVDAALAYCASHPSISAIMVPATGSILTIGLPTESVDWIAGSAA
jgi:thiamine biosynthesis lipoprotein